MNRRVFVAVVIYVITVTSVLLLVTLIANPNVLIDPRPFLTDGPLGHPKTGTEALIPLGNLQ